MERYHDVSERIVSCARGIKEESKGKSATVVSHVMVMTVLYRYLLGNSFDLKRLENTEVYFLSQFEIKHEIN